MLDGFLGLITGWIWEDLGVTAVKSKLRGLEAYLEEWNKEMQEKSKELGPENAPKIVSLRRTGYMHVSVSPFLTITDTGTDKCLQLDIQVPDPEISYPMSTTDGGRTGTGNGTGASRGSGKS